MSQAPVDRLESTTDIEKREDETVREYVDRIGRNHDIDPEVVEHALTYITEWHYSETPPEDDDAFRSLLVEVSDGTEERDGVLTSVDDGSSETDGATDSDVDERDEESDDSIEPDSHGGTEDDSKAVARTEADDYGEGESESKSGPTSGQQTGMKQRSVSATRDSALSDGAENGETLFQDGEQTESADQLSSATTEESATQGFKTGIQGKEPRKLLVRFVLIVATAPVIGSMMARAWVPGNVLYEESRALLTRILGLTGSAAVDLVAVFVGGFYLALLVLFLFDVKKRVQAVLLSLGTGLACGAVAIAGVFFPALAVTPLNGFSFLLGFAAGLTLELQQLVAIDFETSSFRRPTLENGTLPEFRNAATVLFGILAIVVVATLGQVVLADVVTVFDLPASGVFLILLYQFVQYESETSYMTLGPARSGKSMLMLGLCLELLRNAETYPDPNDYLQQSLERASNLQPGTEQWPIPSTAHDEVRAASFEVIAGYYFPRRLELTALDYAGQHLGRVAELFETDAKPDDDDGVPGQVADWIVSADTLFFILDVERLVFPEEFQEAGVTEETNVSWGLEHYETILDHMNPEDVVVIATKCDILIDQGIVDPPSEYSSFDAFGDDITEYFLSRPDVRELMGTTGASAIQPVYFQTRKRDGEYVPRLDADGNLIPVGYTQLIDEIRSRQ